MKVTFEGTDVEIARIVLAAFQQTEAASLVYAAASKTETDTPKAEESKSEGAPSEAAATPVSEQPPVEQNNPETVAHVTDAVEAENFGTKAKVLNFIIDYPNLTLREIATALKMDYDQVRPCTRRLQAGKLITTATAPDNKPFIPHRFIPAKGAIKALAELTDGRIVKGYRRYRISQGLPSTRDIVRGFLNENPGSTSGQVAKAIEMASNQVSASLTTMNRLGMVRSEGAGGQHEPFRYYNVEIS